MSVRPAKQAHSASRGGGHIERAGDSSRPSTPCDCVRSRVEADARMHVVFVASEAVPFAKTGGLADVAGCLAAALEKQRHRAVLFIPGYRAVPAAGLELADTGITLQIPVGPQDGGGSGPREPAAGLGGPGLPDRPARLLRSRRALRHRHDRLRRQLRALRLLRSGRAGNDPGPAGSGPTSSTATTGRPA